MTETRAPADAIRPVLLVPHFDHAVALVAFLPRLVALGHPLIVVDDGSAPDELARLEAAVRERPEVRLLAQPANRGKGAAVMAGAAEARHLGHTHAVQIDADGQHDPDDVAALLDVARLDPTAIVSGWPVFDASAPAVRVHGRKLTTAMIALETLSTGVRDGLCGFRVYPLDALVSLHERRVLNPRMGFDTDVLVRAARADVPLRFVRTRVSYPSDGRSHFDYRRDNAVLVRLHLRLLAGLPAHALRRLARAFSRAPTRGPS